MFVFFHSFAFPRIHSRAGVSRERRRPKRFIAKCEFHCVALWMRTSHVQFNVVFFLSHWSSSSFTSQFNQNILMTNHYGWRKQKKKNCNIVASLEVCATVNEEIKLHGKITMINEMDNVCVIRVVGAAGRAHARFFPSSSHIVFAFCIFRIIVTYI